jgi:hypothetical protein
MRNSSFVFAAGLLMLAGIGQAAAQAPGSVDIYVPPAAGTFGSPGGAAVTSNPQTLMPMLSGAVFARVTANATSGNGGAPSGIAVASAGYDGTRLIPGHTEASVAPQAFGSGANRIPYTTKRSSQASNSGPAAGADDPVPEFPWRATGKLWSRFCLDTSNNLSPFPCTASNEHLGYFVCTASLIKRSLLVTAAHCVQSYGRGAAFRADFVYWEPARYGAVVPYGRYRFKSIIQPAVYIGGTDTCDSAAIGVVCNNDVALVPIYQNNALAALDNQSSAGGLLGIYAYATNGYSGTGSTYLGNRFVAQITQLGYPQAIDSGERQIRTDSIGVYSADNTGVTVGVLEQTTIGSAQTGGSSGGPWLVNFGTSPVHNAGSSAGNAAVQAVVGVTSWGFTDITIKVQGASHFGQNTQFPAAAYGAYGPGNIGALVNAACTAFPVAC